MSNPPAPSPRTEPLPTAGQAALNKLARALTPAPRQ